MTKVEFKHISTNLTDGIDIIFEQFVRHSDCGGVDAYLIQCPPPRYLFLFDG